MDVVLVAPQIATNSGSIIRLCANTGTRLHLVQPLGYSMDSALLRRAGLDYHDLADVQVHAGIPEALTVLGCAAPAGSATAPGRRLFTFRSQAAVRYDTIDYLPGDVLVFGAESAGLSPGQLAELDTGRDLPGAAQVTALRLPMRPHNRSLNLANAVAVVVFEAWRQQGFPGSADTATPAPGHGSTAETFTSAPFDP